jgi:lipopolysaccharide transport periplasmic protein LptA
MRGPIAILLAGTVLAGAALAQQMTITKGMSNPNAPIDLSANDMFADQNTGMVVYTGNVIVKQGEVKLRADKMRAKLVANNPSHLYADGRVVIDAPSGIATGNSGVYDVEPRLITLTGNVVLTKDKNVLRGQKLVVNLITGQATLDGGQGKAGRVQALFTPKNEDGTQKP